jgi:hypothetical protein
MQVPREREKYSSYSFLTSALDGGEWSASRPGRALAPGKGPAFLIVYEAGWAPELVWTQRLEEKSFDSFGDQTPVVQSVVRHYTRGSQAVGRAVGPVGVGARVDCMKDIFSLN